MRRTMIRALLPALAAFAVLMPALATAQPAPDPNAGGPMTVEPIRSTWAIAPDVKITHFDGETDALAGVYGGRVIDNALFVGAAGYWLMDSNRGHELSYGGIFVEWRERTDQPIGFSVKALFGGGSATLSQTVVPLGYGAFLPPGLPPLPPPQPVRLAFKRDFVFAEPEADLLVNFSPRARLHAGVGYRAAGSDDYYRGDRISGVTGTISLEFGLSRQK